MNERPYVQAGDEIELREGDYRYGRGTLRMRVTHVSAGAFLPGREWVGLLGVERLLSGRDGDHRFALVRVEALKRRTYNGGSAGEQHPPGNGGYSPCR